MAGTDREGRDERREGAHIIAAADVEPPPNATPVERRIALPAQQVVGVAILAAIVIAAAAGAFEAEARSATAQTPTLQLSVEYPPRFRYRQSARLRVLATNRSSRTLDTLTVRLDTAYIARFDDVMVTPSPLSSWEVAFSGVGPGETRRVEVQLRGHAYGAHTGVVSAFSAGPDTAGVRVRTFIFP